MELTKRKTNPFKFILIFFILLAAVIFGYIYLSPAFEKNKPVIISENSVYWNLKSKIDIKLKDESGIKYYKVSFVDGEKEIVLDSKVFNEVKKELSFEVSPPKLDMFNKGINTSLKIEVVDNSKWNFLEGNKALKEISIVVDLKKPIANVLSNSRYIQRGGSGVVVVKVKDKNLKDAYITFNNKKRFELIPYYKDDYYVSLIAWPVDIEEFNKVNLVAVDKAKNITITKVPFYIQSKRIQTDKINLSEKFIKDISASVLEQSFEAIPNETKEIFIYSNTVLRDKNVKSIEKIAKKAMEGKKIKDFSIKPFKRLSGSKTVAGFAQRRHYYLDGEKINEAWHLGMDWASIKKASIFTSNKGEVIFNGYLGLYGNTIIIDHSMGLASLYAHTSSQSVQLEEQVTRNQKIANTGATGAVFGDHLHFGVLVQGVEVNPVEWMDGHWIKVRITDVLEDAKTQIDGK